MPTIGWVALWVLGLGTLAFFTVREMRIGRPAPGDVDRMKHQASREAGINQDARGPNGMQSTWFSG